MVDIVDCVQKNDSYKKVLFVKSPVCPGWHF